LDLHLPGERQRGPGVESGVRAMQDDTEETRKSLSTLLNSAQHDRAALEEKYGQVWNTQEAMMDFDFKGFMAPFVVVVRKSDNLLGTLIFQAYPRFYFSFRGDEQ
jgi:hypothetical protein